MLYIIISLDVTCWRMGGGAWFSLSLPSTTVLSMSCSKSVIADWIVVLRLSCLISSPCLMLAIGACTGCCWSTFFWACWAPWTCCCCINDCCWWCCWDEDDIEEDESEVDWDFWCCIEEDDMPDDSCCWCCIGPIWRKFLYGNYLMK